MTHTHSIVIGIDISKADFVVATHNTPDISTYPNTSQGWKDFYTSLKAPQDSFVVLEVTGGYEMGLLTYLCEHEVTCHRANTLKAKAFIKSIRTYGKSDKMDAQALAYYGYERQSELAPFQLQSQSAQMLKTLTLRRNDLIKLRSAEKNRLQAPESACIRKSMKATIRFFDKEIAKLDEQINTVIQEDETLTKVRGVIQEIPGVGCIVAQGMLSLMPELGYINRRQAAALAGLAPYENDSGTQRGYRSIRGGRRELRSIIFMAALSASRSRSRLGSFYKGLIERGKRPLVALTALMRKILVIANAKARDALMELEA